MNSVFKNALVLLVITVIAGAAVGAVYEITEEPRAQQEEKTKNEAYRVVIPDADIFQDTDYDKDALEQYVVSFGISDGTFSVDGVAGAYDSSGSIIGYAVTVTDGEGYGGDIQIVAGILNDGTVKGVSILSISETAGLGMKAKDDSFLSQFAGKLVSSFTYTKDGASEDNEIDAISGATITTNAMTNGVNIAIYSFNYISGVNGGDADE